jgi:hypothetical protein
VGLPYPSADSVNSFNMFRSDGLGHVFAMIGRDWTHLGVAKLYTDITRNGYKIMYLTSRAIGQADATRDYLKGIKQSDYRLPEGPVIMSPDRLMASLHRYVCDPYGRVNDAHSGACLFSEKSSCVNRKFSRWRVCGTFSACSEKLRGIHSMQVLEIVSQMHYHIVV